MDALRRISKPISGLLVVIVTIGTIFGFYFDRLPEDQQQHILYTVGIWPASPTPTFTPTVTPTPSFTPTPIPTATPTATLTPTPERMPATGFNVIVAGLGFEALDGTVTANQLAADMSDIIFDTVRQVPLIENIRGRAANGVGHILGATPAERERQAAQIADLLNADVVIYGLIRSDGLFNIYQPEYYLSGAFTALEPELVGGGQFGEAVEFVGNSDDQIEAASRLYNRLTVLRLFVDGLARYITGNFGAARDSFQQAIDVEAQGLEVLYVFAGNAALRQPDIRAALSYYDHALRTRPAYSRALVGRGSALFQLAREAESDLELAPDFQPISQPAACSSGLLPDDRLAIAQMALGCYDAAQQSSDQPDTADVDVKIAFGRAQVEAWLASHGAAERWFSAQAGFQTVIDLYENADAGRQLRIRVYAAHAYAWMGTILTSTTSGAASVTQAIEAYRTALGLLRLDQVNREYNRRWIDLYSQQAADLEQWLSTQPQSTSAVITVPAPHEATSMPEFRG